MGRQDVNKKVLKTGFISLFCLRSEMQSVQIVGRDSQLAYRE